MYAYLYLTGKYTCPVSLFQETMCSINCLINSNIWTRETLNKTLQNCLDLSFRFSNIPQLGDLVEINYESIVQCETILAQDAVKFPAANNLTPNRIA